MRSARKPGPNAAPGLGEASKWGQGQLHGDEVREEGRLPEVAGQGWQGSQNQTVRWWQWGPGG